MIGQCHRRVANLGLRRHWRWYLFPRVSACYPLKRVAYFLGIFAFAAIPIIYRSLGNYFDRCKEGKSPIDKIVRKRIANNVIDSLEDTSALCRDAVQCHQKVMDRLTDLGISDTELMMHLYEILSDVQSIWRKARAARNGEYV